jgi:hypothetical protein
MIGVVSVNEAVFKENAYSWSVACPTFLFLWASVGATMLFKFDARMKCATQFPSILLFELMSKTLYDACHCLGISDWPRYKRSNMDRSAHTREISQAILKIINKTLGRFCWLGFCGPWPEDTWIDMAGAVPFSDFGPFVPFFVPWNKIYWHLIVVNQSNGYRTVNRLIELITPNFLYVTLTTNSYGIGGKTNYSIPYNLLILSQGGSGHVALPLWLYSLDWHKFPILKSYKYDAVFLGSLRNHRVRPMMVNAMRAIMPHTRIFIGISHNWINIYRQSKFIMTPRGFGRNSYRLMETLQMGMVPVYIYTDFLWLPYYDSINWSSFAVITSLRDLNQTLRFLLDCPVERVNEMRVKSQSFQNSHFSVEGMWRQIRRFLRYGFEGTDLRCGRFSSWPDEASVRF